MDISINKWVSIRFQRERRRTGKSVGVITHEYLSLIVEDELEREMELIMTWKGKELRF